MPIGLMNAGAMDRAEYVRLWVTLNEPTNKIEDEEMRARLNELKRIINRHWVHYIDPFWLVADDDCSPELQNHDGQIPDAILNYRPCILCGRCQNRRWHVSRMPCENCGCVLCWQCADTGVHGSLPDFQHFVTGKFARPNFQLDRQCCPFCQTMTWMKAHGG